jgi:hypothetical protein
MPASSRHSRHRQRREAEKKPLAEAIRQNKEIPTRLADFRSRCTAGVIHFLRTTMIEQLTTVINEFNARIAAARAVGDHAEKNALTTRRNQLHDVRAKLRPIFDTAEHLLLAPLADVGALHNWIEDHLVPGGQMHPSEIKRMIRAAGILSSWSQVQRALADAGIDTRFPPYFNCSTKCPPATLQKHLNG